MSYQEESIYNLIPKVSEPPPKPPQHASKFSSPVREEYRKNKQLNRTMGPAKVAVNEPKKFLKKHEKEPKLPDKSVYMYPDENARRPPVPKHTEKPVMGLKSNKNFITNNAVENIMSVPKKPAAKFADTKDGKINDLEPSGLVPKYLKKKDYGKTPAYLVQRKEDMEQAQRDYDEYVRENMKRGAMNCLTNGERQAIIDGLKTNWEEIYHQYQGLSVVTDTAPKKNRKERMEGEMNQLERDIELLEKHSHIYIANNYFGGY